MPAYFQVEQFARDTLITHLIDAAQADRWLNLSDQQTLAAIIEDTALLLGIVDEDSPIEHRELAEVLSGQAAGLLSEANTLLQQAAAQFETGRVSSAVTALSDIAKIHTLVQTRVAPVIAACATGANLDDAVSQFSHRALLAALDTIEAGFLDSQTPANRGSALTNLALPARNSHAPEARDEWFLDFDGVDDYIQIGSDAYLEMTATLTMEAWVKPDRSNNINQMIINKEGEYEMGLFPDGTIRWAFKNANPGWDWHNTGHVVAADEWVHIAVSYDNGAVRTYVNGVLVETYQGSGVIGDAHALLDDLRIGGRSNAPPGKYFDGAIGEVRIWNIVRTGAEIAAYWDQPLTGLEAGLAGNWRLTEGSGAVVDDKSSLNNDGVLGGGVTAQQPAWKGYTVREDGILVVPAFLGVASNDFDEAGHGLSVFLVSGANDGTVSLNPDGSFTYTPAADFAGIDQFRYKITDGVRNGNAKWVTIDVSSVNDVPAISSDGAGAHANLSVDENTAAVTLVAATDPDTGDTLTYSIIGGHDQALFAIDGDSGALIFSSAPDFEAPMDTDADNVYRVNIQVDDGQGGIDTQVLAVTVTDLFGF